MKTKLLTLTLLAATAGLVAAFPRDRAIPPTDPQPQPQPIALVQPQARPLVEAVFVLDTTGSMSGLIETAKENIWSIASSMSAAQPTPELRIGLVAFRDRGDSYVTRVIDLSTDLDSMYATLMDFRADGGGDTPESVNKALLDAVHKVAWSADPQAYRTIFLIGDAPPQQYQDEPGYAEIVRAATARGIKVNAIQAGHYAATTPVWREIAQIGGGEFFQVEQGGSRIAVATPYDERIAALSKELDDTRLFFGDEDRQREMAAKQAAADKLHVAASPAARAKRANFNASGAGKSNLLGDSELVEAVTSGKVALDAIAPAHLPASIRELPREEQAQKIAETAGRRADLAAQIARLAGERDAHIKAELATKDGKEDSFDYRLHATVRAQAAEVGLEYAAEPTH